MASRSRWLVGSSSSSRSDGHISACARFRRMRQPPEKSPTGSSICSLAEAQAGQQLARAGVGAVAVGVVQLGVQAAERGAVVGLPRRPPARAGCGAGADVAVEHVVDRAALQGIDLLAHVRDAPVRRATGTRRRPAPSSPRSRANRLDLPAPLAPIESGLLAGMQGQLGAFEQALRATLQGQVLESDHRLSHSIDIGRASGDIVRAGLLRRRSLSVSGKASAWRL